MRAVGIILAGGKSTKIGDLGNRRAIAAMPIGGSFRAIDFTLSNMSNSHIQKVGVVTQYNSKSVTEHLSSSKWWDFGRKQGGLSVFTPTITADNSYWYRGTADAIYQNISFLKNSHEPYVVICSGDGIYKLDYNRILEYHIDKKADITIVLKNLKGSDHPERFGVVDMNYEGRIIGFEQKPLASSNELVSVGVYVIRRRLLIELLEEAAKEERYDIVNDILIRYRGIKKIYGYEMDSYWRNIATVESYYRANMDFLNAKIRNYFYREFPSVYSKIDDLPPAKYNPGAQIKNSLISSGCIVNGNVENSILFKKVYVGNNCTIKNSIILNDVYIGDNAYIENCIVESRDTIRANTTHIGEENNPRIVVEKNERYVL